MNQPKSPDILWGRVKTPPFIVRIEMPKPTESAALFKEVTDRVLDQGKRMSGTNMVYASSRLGVTELAALNDTLRTIDDRFVVAGPDAVDTFAEGNEHNMPDFGGTDINILEPRGGSVNIIHADRFMNAGEVLLGSRRLMARYIGRMAWYRTIETAFYFDEPDGESFAVRYEITRTQGKQDKKTSLNLRYGFAGFSSSVGWEEKVLSSDEESRFLRTVSEIGGISLASASV